MKLELVRIYNCDRYCIGKLYIDGAYYCDTIEDTDRMLTNEMGEKEISKIKVNGKTAIPIGTYNINMNIISPRFSKKAFYIRVCEGKLPRLELVKGFSGVLIHVGNDETDTDGCILVGWNKEKGKVLNSKMAFENLYYKLKAAKSIGSKITITISRKYKE